MAKAQDDPNSPLTRGRNTSPKPLVSSRGSSAASTPTSPIVPGAGTDERGRKVTSSGLAASPEVPAVESPSESPPEEASNDQTIGLSPRPPLDSGSAGPGAESRSEGFTVRVVDRTTWVSTSGPPPLRTAPAPIRRTAPRTEENAQETTDSLQANAAEYPWLYMSSTLDACFDNTESSKLQPDSSEKSNNVAQDRVLFGAAESDEFSKTAPIVMQAFHIHGETCTRVEAEALQLALHGSKSSEEDEEARLQAYRDMLDELEALHAEALTLESSIEELTSAQNAEDRLDAETTEPSARSQILGVISASLPVIKARIMNLSMAQELVDSALENLTMSLRMESLGIE